MPALGQAGNDSTVFQSTSRGAPELKTGDNREAGENPALPPQR